jgi:endonuclease-3
VTPVSFNFEYSSRLIPASTGRSIQFVGWYDVEVSGQRAAKEGRRVSEILIRLAEHYPAANCALAYEDAFQLLVATILSAQCTDERVNQVTPELFLRFPTARMLATAETQDVEEIIRSTGFFRNKAKSLLGSARRVANEFGGEVPDRMEDLLSLPGVARKTANVVLGTWFNIASGIVVDTHVRRVSGRFGLTEQTDPGKIEADLMALLPREQWIDFSHRVIHFGRGICKAPKPRCQDCFLVDLCPYVTTQGISHSHLR